MREKTNLQLVVDCLIGLDLIVMVAELIAVLGLMYHGWRISDEYAHYQRLVHGCEMVYVVVTVSYFVVPLFIYPLLRLFWRLLSKFKIGQILSAGARAIGRRIGSIHLSKVQMRVLTIVALAYAVFTLIASGRLVYGLNELSYDEIRLLMRMWAPKVCSLLWQSLAVFVACVLALVLLMFLYDESKSSEEDTEEKLELENNEAIS